MRVVMIDDDQRLVSNIALCLRVKYPDVDVVSAGDGRKGIHMVETESPNLVIIGTSSPNADTLALIKNIREFSGVPLVVLSETTSDMDRARGLEAGADEYVTEPSSPVEFLARVSALLRRTQGPASRAERSISVGELTIHLTNHDVFLSGRRVDLTPIQYRLLSELMKNEGRVLTHRALLDKVWGQEYDDYHLVKTNIYRIRLKLEGSTKGQPIIQSERGIGYRLVRNA